MSHHTNISCSRILESVDAYIDDQLSGDEVARFEGHVANCARCRHELALARHVLKETRELPSVPCPDEVTERVFVATVGPRSAHERLGRWLVGRRWRAVRLATVAGAAFAVFFIAFLSRQHTPEEEFSQAEISEAQAAVRWTFAYVNEVSWRSGLAVRDEVFETGLVDPVRRAVRSVIEVEPDTKRNHNGG